MLQDGSRIAYLSDQLTIWGPRILVAILILIVTHFVARLVRWGLIKLVDKIPLLTKASSESDSDLAGSMGTLGYWVIWLVGLLVALQPLGLTQAMAPINALTQEVFTYLPRIIGAGIIFFVGVLIARIART
ncbi:mechanosensitive ion channel, partial [Pseudomonas stutzeri]|nr:mechanosensitive ion channel [Stutzerimonas stutzeri]